MKQNKRKLIYSQAHVNGTDHHLSESCCDLISPARRTTTVCEMCGTLNPAKWYNYSGMTILKYNFSYLEIIYVSRYESNAVLQPTKWITFLLLFCLFGFFCLVWFLSFHVCHLGQYIDNRLIYDGARWNGGVCESCIMRPQDCVISQVRRPFRQIKHTFAFV